MRLNKKFRPFKKGYLPEWTKEVFVVRKVVPDMATTTYKVQELDDTSLQGTFYAWDLQKVHLDEVSYFRVEKDKKMNCTSSGKGIRLNITVGSIKKI